MEEDRVIAFEARPEIEMLRSSGSFERMIRSIRLSQDVLRRTPASSLLLRWLGGTS